MQFRIGHLAYKTGNMEASLDFYIRCLGFRHAFSLANDDGKPWIEYLMSADGRFVELFWPETGEIPRENGNYMHLCLEVDDCAAAVAELEEKGVAIRIRPRQGKDGNWQAWIRDPDGRDVEIMQLNPESGQAKARG